MEEAMHEWVEKREADIETNWSIIYIESFSFYWNFVSSFIAIDTMTCHLLTLKSKEVCKEWKKLKRPIGSIFCYLVFFVNDSDFDLI